MPLLLEAIAASLTAMANLGVAARPKSTVDAVSGAFRVRGGLNDMAATRDPRRKALKGDFEGVSEGVSIVKEGLLSRVDAEVTVGV